MSDSAARFPKRSARAARTRAAIIAAAATLFEQRGFAGTTMKAIAETAGVSVESVYAMGSKSSLLATAMTVAFAVALGAYADLVSDSIARSDALWRTARAAADAEPDIRTLLDASRARRHADLAMAGPWLVSRGAIAADEVEYATATVSVLVSHEVYEHLIDDFGWTRTQYTTWLRTSLRRLALPHPAPPIERND